MGMIEILASIDHQIAQLERARALLSGRARAVHSRKGDGPGSTAFLMRPASAKPAKRKKRNLTPEGRKRIAEAVKRRWEAQKKAAAQQ